METRVLGRTDVRVSRVILGCGNFGGIGSAPAFFGQGTPREEALRLLDTAWDLGITTLDTADAYGGGRSETIVGEWLASKPPEVRDRVVVTTKTFNPVVEGGDRGLSRMRIRRQVDVSRTRLGLEHIPLYMAHDFDPDTPQEETLETFDALVRAGAIGAVGASLFTAEQLAEALELSKLEGLVRYEWAQEAYSLLDHRARETVVPLVHEHGIGLTSFSPLAGGLLTGKYRRDEAIPSGSRMDLRPGTYGALLTEDTFGAIDALSAAARERGVSTAALALAWLLHLPDVTAVVIGPGRVEHLEPVLEAVAITLDDAERDALEELFH